MKPLNGYCYPWQQQQWHTLLAMKAQARIPHALLLVGYKGLGKLAFAQQITKAILCAQSNAAGYCNQCRNCHLYDVANHPDYTLLAAPADTASIKIDDVRQLLQTTSQTPQQANYKVIVIAPAEAMNIAAANALLKVLEEPPSQTIFLLVCNQLYQIPATIRSRCQMVKFTAPSIQEGCQWLNTQGEASPQNELLLELAHYSPLLATQLLHNAYFERRNEILTQLQAWVANQTTLVEIVEQWITKDIDSLIKLLISIHIDMIRLQSKLDLNYITHKDIAIPLQELANGFTLSSLYRLLDKLYQMQQWLSRATNINQSLLLEDFLATLTQQKNVR